MNKDDFHKIDYDLFNVVSLKGISLKTNLDPSSLWIKCSERLPEDEQKVLCIDNEMRYFTAVYSRVKVRYSPGYMDTWDHGFCCGREPNDPIYWMSLPPLAKE